MLKVYLLSFIILVFFLFSSTIEKSATDSIIIGSEPLKTEILKECSKKNTKKFSDLTANFLKDTQDETTFYFGLPSPDIDQIEKNIKLFEEEKIKLNDEDLQIVVKLQGIESNWDQSIMKNLTYTSIMDKGFLPKPDNRVWVIEVINNRDYNLKDITIIYKISAYRYNISYDESTATILSSELELFKKFDGNVSIADLNKKANELIFYMGTLPYVEVEIEAVIINGANKELTGKSENKYYGFDWVSDKQDFLILTGQIAPTLNIPSEIEKDLEKNFSLITESFENIEEANLQKKRLENIGIEDIKTIENKDGTIFFELGEYEKTKDIQVVFNEIFYRLSSPKLMFKVSVVDKITNHGN